MDKIHTYTSTGLKILHHPEVIRRVIDKQIATPITIQVAPTSRCNLKCVFCSNVNREKHETLCSDLVLSLIFRLQRKGLKAVEWTGGGDPLMYEPIARCVELCNEMGLEQGLITNGLKLCYFSPNFLNKFKWIRISMNCLDYKDIKMPEFPSNVTVGYSYVMNKNTRKETLEKLHGLVRKYNPAYVRIVPNCQTSNEKLIQDHKVYSAFVNRMGNPYFYQAKMFSRPQRCWWGYFKPFLLHNGYVYPCSSVVLNNDSERSFHSKYRWKRMNEFPNYYDFKMVPFDCSSCTHCVFRQQNDIVDSLINPSGMENFI